MPLSAHVGRATVLRIRMLHLYDRHFPRPGEIIHHRDLNVFRTVMQQRRQIRSALLRIS
jgi:hypothetical protein